MCEGGKGANVLPLFYKRGQMSTIIHLLGGKCPPLSITWGADVLIYHFSQGGRCPRGEMSGSRNAYQTLFVLKVTNALCTYISNLEVSNTK